MSPLQAGVGLRHRHFDASQHGPTLVLNTAAEIRDRQVSRRSSLCRQSDGRLEELLPLRDTAECDHVE